MGVPLLQQYKVGKYIIGISSTNNPIINRFALFCASIGQWTKQYGDGYRESLEEQVHLRFFVSIFVWIKQNNKI